MTSSPPPLDAEAIGLPAAAVAAIREVLASHPEVQSAILYGSRALGRHRPASDIDLTLTGPALTGPALSGPALSGDVLARIDADLDDLLLPWVIDLSVLATISHPALLEHIQRAGVVLYQRQGGVAESEVAD